MTKRFNYLKTTHIPLFLFILLTVSGCTNNIKYITIRNETLYYTIDYIAVHQGNSYEFWGFEATNILPGQCTQYYKIGKRFSTYENNTLFVKANFRYYNNILYFPCDWIDDPYERITLPDYKSDYPFLTEYYYSLAFRIEEVDGSNVLKYFLNLESKK